MCCRKKKNKNWSPGDDEEVFDNVDSNNNLLEKSKLIVAAPIVGSDMNLDIPSEEAGTSKSVSTEYDVPRSPKAEKVDISELKYWMPVVSSLLKANPNPKMKWVSDERALAGVHFS